MLLILDNDIILKLSALSILTELEKLFHVKENSIYVLPTAKHYISNSKIVKKNYPQEVIDSALKEISRYCSITDQVNEEHYKILANNENIDSGEQLLFSIESSEDFMILTGDKRSIKQLNSNALLEVVKTKLIQKIVCLEKILLIYTENNDFDTLNKKMVESNYCYNDKELSIIFNQSNLTKEKALEGLFSYYNELKKLGDGLLFSLILLSLFIFNFK